MGTEYEHAIWALSNYRKRRRAELEALCRQLEREKANVQSTLQELQFVNAEIDGVTAGLRALGFTEEASDE